jgi:hypothetical protein
LNWASAGYLPDGRTVGLNLGWASATFAATENCLVLRAHPVDKVPFIYDPHEYMRSDSTTTKAGSG